ncbi:YncE family protein [Pseudogemmobacter bohemicus]|uniref:YncE family protein n=1 Tax=Pseudogemmobacter bohemicus TaxID=2250708 RepID=UPI000DD4BBD8|nr:YncE family protein [Pseudogemmobacter bohemicus]
MLQKPVAQGIYEIVYSPRQRAVFVASAGGRGEAADPARILKLDPETLDMLDEIALPGRGFGLVLDDAADRLYISDATEATITVADTSRCRVLGQVRLTEKRVDANGREGFPFHCRELAVDPAAGLLYAPCHSMEDSVLCVIDTTSLEVQTRLSGFGFVATGIATDPARGRLFISNAEGQLFTVATQGPQTGGPQITATRATAGDQLMNLALDHQGGRLFATDQGHDFFETLWARHRPGYQRKGPGNQLLVLEAATGEEITRLPTGTGPLAVLYDAGRQLICVTDRSSGSVSLFEGESYALKDRIALQGHPNSLALDGQGGVLYVTVKQGETGTPDAPDQVARIPLAG